jgi:hypothetical protein
MGVDFRHCQVLDLVGSAVAFPKSIEFWKDRRMGYKCKLDNADGWEGLYKSPAWGAISPQTGSPPAGCMLLADLN